MRILSTTLLSVILAFTFVSLKSDKKFYDEINRPQFHFSPEKNWQGAPAGLLFYKGNYHMFYQHNPKALNNKDLHLGHAVSRDLVHWKHLPVALSVNENLTDENCSIFSGSAIVDEHNLLGKQTDDEKTLVLFYTTVNCKQRIAYSIDKGKTWERFDKNPVFKSDKEDAARDPKVIWHEPSKKWIMLLYRETDKEKKTQGVSFYTSEDLINWEWKSHLYGFSGNPDLVELQVTNRPNEKKWILFDNNGSYLLGDFDGEKFTAESPKIASDLGKNYYATQIWSNTDNKRIIQIAWMRGGKFPEMPFNGQMTFPSELSLTKFNSGYKLIRKPIKEIKQLHDKHYKWVNKNLIPGLNENKVKKVSGDCLHIIGDFDIKTSDNFGFMIRYGKKDPGIEVLYNVKREMLSALGSNVPLKPIDNHIKLEILLDRTSLEIYANDGQTVISNCYLADKKSDKIVLFTNGGELGITKLDIYKMKSIWEDE